MPAVYPTKPNAGDPTRRSFAAVLVDVIIFLLGVFESVADTTIPNASFDTDNDANNIPDEWTETPIGSNGSLTLDTTDQVHGGKSLKMTQPLGAGNGGYAVETSDFFSVSSKRPLEIQFTHYATSASMHNKVEVRWFDRTQTFISTSTIWDSVAAGGSPVAWTVIAGTGTPPATARYAKLKITGGVNDVNVGASAFWDDFKFQESSSRAHRTQTIITGSGTWTCPAHVTRVDIRLWGGGAGGINSAAGGGGGGGEYVEAVLSVNPGQNYTVNIGAGGGVGVNGGDTNIGALLTAAGGDTGSGNNGGLGGTGGGGSASGLRIKGQRGMNGVAAVMPGSGGSAGGGGGAGGASGGGAADGDGIVPGGGGAGNGGAGAAGRIIIEY